MAKEQSEGEFRVTESLDHRALAHLELWSTSKTRPQCFIDEDREPVRLSLPKIMMCDNRDLFRNPCLPVLVLTFTDEA